jgi:hypothetical protein
MANNNRRNGRTASEPAGAPRWVVFMGGVTSGVLATVLVGAMLWPRTGVLADAMSDSPAIASATADENDVDVKYEYDSMLRNSEVPVPAAGTTESAAPVLESPQAPARVVLQAGSFRTREDAEGMRAQLLLLDIGPVSTREALLADGNVWHRVFIGPFPSNDAKRKAQDKLMQQNINTFSIAAPADMPMPAAEAATARPAPAARAPGAGNRPEPNPVNGAAPANNTAEVRPPKVVASGTP